MDTLEDNINQLCSGLKVPQPIEFLTQVMAGHDPRHLSRIYELILEIEASIGEGVPPDNFDWMELVSLIKERYQYSPVGLSESHSAAKQIMEYTHAKKKQVDHSGTISNGEEVQPLTKKEVRLFNKRFNHEY